MATYTIKQENGTARLFADGVITDAKLTVRNGADKELYYFLPKGYESVQGQAKTVLVDKAIAEKGSYTLKERVHVVRTGSGTANKEFNPADWLSGDDKTAYEALVKKATETHELRSMGFADATLEELNELQVTLATMRAKEVAKKAEKAAEAEKVGKGKKA